MNKDNYRDRGGIALFEIGAADLGLYFQSWPQIPPKTARSHRSVFLPRELTSIGFLARLTQRKDTIR
jgi:hypothetical protein